MHLLYEQRYQQRSCDGRGDVDLSKKLQRLQAEEGKAKQLETLSQNGYGGIKSKFSTGQLMNLPDLLRDERFYFFKPDLG